MSNIVIHGSKGIYLLAGKRPSQNKIRGTVQRVAQSQGWAYATEPAGPSVRVVLYAWPPTVGVKPGSSHPDYEVYQHLEEIDLKR